MVTDDQERGIRIISIYATPFRKQSKDVAARIAAAPQNATKLRTKLRIATKLRLIAKPSIAEETGTGTGPTVKDDLPLSPRLEEFHYLFSEQLPQLIDKVDIPISRLSLATGQPTGPADGTATKPLDVGVTRLQARLFLLPSDQVVAALDLQLASEPLDVDAGPTIRLLDYCAFAQFTIDGLTVGQFMADRCEERGCTLIDKAGTKYRNQLPPERHQIVFAPALKGTAQLTEDVLERILYRTEPPFRPEFMDIRSPDGLNPKDGHAMGRVTLYTSLLVGHNEYIQNSVFLTGVQAVGTSARFRQIWHTAHGMVRGFRNSMQAEALGVQSRDGMEDLADELGNLELELSFSVETSSDLGLLLPTLRSISFHHQLYEVMELKERAERVSSMFIRLGSSIRSELTAIDIRDARSGDRRRRTWTVAINALSLVLVPVTVLLAYFGVGTDDVAHNESIFDYHHYWPIYLVAVGLALVPMVSAALALGILVRKDRKRRDKPQLKAAV